ncbi:MAG: phosphoglucomutase (alpha-D-glucose-1,6-bisphosphate-dependent) [Thermoguttaceae bacterium]
MSIHPLAGLPVPPELILDVSALEKAYYAKKPDVSNPMYQVAFGTSGHRGTPNEGTFTESHILAIVQAVCDYRQQQGYSGPLFLGKDTHAISTPAQRTALEVLAANGVETVYQREEGYTPTPVISHAILGYNRNRRDGFADGIVITPSHNPPTDGGIKYNTPNGGPADTTVTAWIQDRANAILADESRAVRRIPFEQAVKASNLHANDYIIPYISDLKNVVDLELIAKTQVSIGCDPLGGASVAYWPKIAEMYGLNLTVVNDKVDPSFQFMTVDHDGKVRMDCSSPYSMRGLVRLKDGFDIAIANDPDSDRHGIVTPTEGLMSPNHYLAVAIHYLFTNRPKWSSSLKVGKTLVSSSMIDRVVKNLNRPLFEVPVGFKWFVDGLFAGTLGFGGEESAGASFLRFDGTVWSTDKDGIIPDLLGAEMIAKTGRNPSEHYAVLEQQFGRLEYTRVDQPATPDQKAAFKTLTPDRVSAREMGGEPIVAKLTQAPGNNASFGGLKVETANGWFAARPSGTENIYKIYAESFLGEEHLGRILEEARTVVGNALTNRG